MIGWTVNASSRSGARGSRTRLRSAITSVSDTRRLMLASSSSSVRRSSAAWPVSVRNTSSSVGRAQREVVDADARLVEPAHRLDDRAGALAHASASRRRPR